MCPQLGMVFVCFSVVVFGLIMRGNCRSGLFSEVRETGAYKVRPGGFRRSEGGGGALAVSVPRCMR